MRCAAISSNGIAATGSADETIKLFDTHKRLEIGTLLHHQGLYVVAFVEELVKSKLVIAVFDDIHLVHSNDKDIFFQLSNV